MIRFEVVSSNWLSNLILNYLIGIEMFIRDFDIWRIRGIFEFQLNRFLYRDVYNDRKSIRYRCDSLVPIIITIIIIIK